MPFCKGDPNINRAGTKPGFRKPRNVAAIFECFQKMKINLRDELPADFKPLPEWKHITIYEFQMVADLFRNKNYYPIIDRLSPTLKAVDITTDGAAIDKPAMNINVISADTAAVLSQIAAEGK